MDLSISTKYTHSDARKVNDFKQINVALVYSEILATGPSLNNIALSVLFLCRRYVGSV